MPTEVRSPVNKMKTPKPMPGADKNTRNPRHTSIYQSLGSGNNVKAATSSPLRDLSNPDPFPGRS